jgi:hypothetical protein
MGQLIQFPTKTEKKTKFNTDRQRINVHKIVNTLEELDTGSLVISVDTMQKAINLYFKKNGVHSYPTK